MKYRLALDMGSTSLGWCLLALDQNHVPSSLIDMGIRIFSDGREDKSKQFSDIINIQSRVTQPPAKNPSQYVLF